MDKNAKTRTFAISESGKIVHEIRYVSFNEAAKLSDFRKNNKSIDDLNEFAQSMGCTLFGVNNRG